MNNLNIVVINKSNYIDKIIKKLHYYGIVELQIKS
jgi:hypothetical protein